MPSIFCILLTCTFFCICLASNDDLYSILGVSRDASVTDIKRAYRRKARDTHPDKQKNVDTEQANEEFRKVVDAFEILSDQNSRQFYNRTGKTSSQQQNTQQQHYQHTWSWHFSSSSGRRRRSLKDNPKVKEAMLRVMHVVSLEQLETVMLDNDMKLERSLLICFVTPPIENIMNDQLLFPYPFAGMSSQSIWWEDLLQTVVVRYHKSNDLTEFFGIPQGDNLKEPTIVLVRKGDALSNFVTLSTSHRETFENWVWKQLSVPIQFTNKHDHPVELYWADGTTAKLKTTIPPNHTYHENTMLSHEYIARDIRVDAFDSSPGRYKIPPNSRLGTWKILSTEPHFITITSKSCVDMSGHCQFWSMNPRGECERNPGFMHDKCPKTCNVCSDDNEEEDGAKASSKSAKDEL